MSSQFDIRRSWILNYIRKLPEGSWVDVLNASFVDAYVEATGAAFAVMPYGAHKCRLLGKDLAQMEREGSLTRSRTGIQGLAGQGFPTWVWTYRLAEHLREHGHKN